MKHIAEMTKMPSRAASNIPVDTLLTFIIALLSALKPILVAKYPNPS